MKIGHFTVLKGYHTKREEWINDEPKTWVRNGKYKGWHIQIRKEANRQYKFNLRGSLHKFYHGSNAGSFSGLEVLAAIEGMCDLFQIDSAQTSICNIEIGINVQFPVPVYPYLESNLLYHKKKLPVQMDSTDVIGFVFQYDEYRVKVYQKEPYILRFELKYTASAKLKEFGVATLADLGMSQIIRLSESLLPQWNEIILRGGINVMDEKRNPHGLTEREIKKLLQYSSKFYQQSYNEKLNRAQNKRAAENLQVQSYRLKKFCLEIINDKGDKLHSKVAADIKTEVKEFRESFGNVMKSASDKTAENITVKEINNTTEVAA